MWDSQATNRWMLFMATKAVLMFWCARWNLCLILLTEFFDFSQVPNDTLDRELVLSLPSFEVSLFLEDASINSLSFLSGSWALSISL
jgi:hypothetical protein